VIPSAQKNDSVIFLLVLLETISYILCFVVYCVSCLGRHGPTEARRALGPCWVLLLPTWLGVVQPKHILCCSGLKRGGLVLGQHGTTQVAALLASKYIAK
jgi:hypothetical protein